MKCPICRYRHANNRHHLIPKSEGGTEERSNKMDICRKCHRKVHKMLTNETLAKSCHTTDLLMAHVAVQAIITEERYIWNAKCVERERWATGYYTLEKIAELLRYFFTWVYEGVECVVVPIKD